VETSVPIPTSRSYPVSTECAYHRRRIFTVIRAHLAVGYAILARIRFALCGRHRPSQIFPDTKLALGASRRLGELRSSRIRLEKLLDLVEDP
jgi:hypothetical protein